MHSVFPFLVFLINFLTAFLSTLFLFAAFNVLGANGAHNLTTLLTFYGLATNGTLTAKGTRLAQVIGVRTV